jgi:hypothetical protein
VWLRRLTHRDNNSAITTHDRSGKDDPGVDPIRHEHPLLPSEPDTPPSEPDGQAPQEPPHPSSPQLLPAQLGVHEQPAPFAGRELSQSAQVSGPIPSDPVVGNVTSAPLASANRK